MDMNADNIRESLVSLNPCVRFVVDNYEMLCAVHGGKTVLVMECCEFAVKYESAPPGYVAKTFDSMMEAMAYTLAMDMAETPYVLKECNGYDVWENLIYSIGCKNRN